MSNFQEIKIGICISTHNRKSLLESLLIQLVDQISDHDLIIVTIDGSTDGTLELLKNKFPSVKYILGDGKWWYTRSINMGLRLAVESGCDYCLTLNDDCEIPRDYLYNFRKLVSSHDLKDAVVGSVNVVVENGYKLSFGGLKYRTSLLLRRKPYYPYLIDFDTIDKPDLLPTYGLTGRGMFISSRILSEMNFFDERFPQYGSDDDFVLRAKENHFPVFISYKLIVYENRNYSSKDSGYKKTSFQTLIKSLLNKHSLNSMDKNIRFNMRHGKKLLYPIYLILAILGPVYSRYIKHRT